jgi:hypothetical protein
MLRKLTSILLFLACAVALPGARVVPVEVTSRNDVLAGKPFGDAGAYECILGRVYYAVPVAKQNGRSLGTFSTEGSMPTFPAIPSVNRPKDVVEGWHLDFGPTWRNRYPERAATQARQTVSRAGSTA